MNNDNLKRRLTKKQIKLLVRIYAGSQLLNLPTWFHDACDADHESIEQERKRLAVQFLGRHPSFGTDEDIYNYVKQTK
jgi:hypothetical protein